MIRTTTGYRLVMLFLSAWLTTTSSIAQTTPPFSLTTDPRDTLGRQLEAEQQRMIDPALGRVPYERLAQERERILGQKKAGISDVNAPTPGMTWQERGPSNAGGVTRAVLFDPNDPTHKKVWVGSPSGGLWYINDITDVNAIWTPVSDDWESTVVTCLAADPANPQIMYAGTGDAYQYRTGGGIWKTTNGGTTWNRLISTIPGTFYGTLAASFGYIQRLVVTGTGQVFAANRYGVAHSADGGITWQYALAPTQAIGIGGTPTNNYSQDFVSALEAGTDGIVYAAFNPSRVFRANSPAGTAWTEITPAGVPAGGKRTELALAPSTSGSAQVVYALTSGFNSGNFSQDIRWFRKTTDAGATWSSVTVPTHAWGGHFTIGQAERAMSLVSDPLNANILYAGGYDAFRSTDGGITWSNRLTNTNSYFYGLSMQPANGGNVLIASNKGLSWATDWGNGTASTTPQLLSRNNGYRIGNVGAAAMKTAPGSAYLLSNIVDYGLATISNAGLSVGSRKYESDGYAGRAIIDDDAPSLQLFNAGSSWYRLTENSPTYLFTLAGWVSTNPVAYDSQSNTLYVAEYVNNGYSIRRAVGMGGTPVANNFPIAGYPTAMRLSNDRNSLFVGYNTTLLTKYTNCTQSAPISTTIASNAVLPPHLEISSIDVGATDNELLLTASNYGVSSVWYTNNGGATWVNKDAAGAGLPDVPVRTGLFNPQNRQQVILGTDLGVWTTNDITATNPGWTLSSTGMGLMKINQLSYRASDGRLIAATAGRGIFETNALAVPYTPSSVSITNVSNTTLCAGSTFAVSFTTSGPISASAANYEVWVSDAMGNFTNQKRIGTGTSSPISVTLPTGYNALPYGTGYRIRIVAVELDIQSVESSPLAIGNLTQLYIIDRGTAENSYSSGTTICPTDQARLMTRAETGSYLTYTTPETFAWTLNGTTLSGAVSSSVLVQDAGSYQVTAKQAGCVAQSYEFSISVSNSVYANVKTPYEGFLPRCADRPIKLETYYIGEATSLQWLRDGVAIPGATSYSYAASTTGRYSLSVANGLLCQAYSLPARLVFGTSLYAKINRTSESDSVLCLGTNRGNIQLNAFGITWEQVRAGDYSIKWYRNNSLFDNQTNYIVTSLPGVYHLELTQGSCTTRSNGVTVGEGAITTPVIYNQSGVNTLCRGRTVGLQLVSGSTSYNGFQWQRNGVDIPGATSTVYYAPTTGVYALRVVKGSCSAVSAPISITISNTVVPGYVFPLYNQTRLNGIGCSEYRMSCSMGFDNATFQWYRNGQPIAGATGGGYVATQSGIYSFSVTGSIASSVCVGKSRDINVQIGRADKPILSLNQPVGGICQNNTYKLTAQYDQGTLQWKRNGILLSTNAIDPYPVNYLFVNQSGTYSAVLQDNTCATESDPVEVRIGEPITAAITGNALVNSGQVAQLPVAFTGPAPWSFTLNNGQSVQNTYLNPYPLSVTATGTSTYSVVAVDNACGTGTSSGQATVTVGSGQADLSVLAQVSSRTPRVNDIVSYSLLVTNAGPQDVSNVQVNSRLPVGVEFVDAQSAGVSAAGGVVSGNVPALLVNETAVLTYRLRVTQPGTYFTAAQITTTNTPDPDSQPNSGTGDGQDDAASVDLRTADAAGTLVASANPNQVPLPRTQSNQPPTSLTAVELSLDMRSSTQTPKAGDVISLSLTVANRGGAAANNIVVQTVLPAGWQLSNATGFVVSGQTVKAYVNQLAVNGKTVLVLPVQVSAGGGQVRTQILEVAEPVSNAIPGNGYQNGERDEANVVVRVR